MNYSYYFNQYIIFKISQNNVLNIKFMQFNNTNNVNKKLNYLYALKIALLNTLNFIFTFS